jgi:endonuclease YncB( thermonuclease family)
MGFALYGAQNDKSVARGQKGAAMPVFTAASIIDGDTFEVNLQWEWKGETGTRVRPAGYNAPELYAYGGETA